MQVDYDIFTAAGPPEEGKTYTPAEYDLRLKPGAKCVDAGTLIPQVADNFRGTAPDLGCYEQGQDSAHYGPRKLPK
jgi:hypothetical protein